MSRTYDGPTGDVNTAFVRKVQDLLSSASHDNGSVTAALQASPLYDAIIRFTTSENAKQQQEKQQQEKQHSAPSNTVAEKQDLITVSSSSLPGAPVVPLAIARRGIGPKDPLLLRKLKKQQQLQRQHEQLPPSSPSSTSSSSNLKKDVNSRAVGHEEEHQNQQQILHWSRRPLQAMTSAGWDVFREQLGIHIEVVARRATNTQKQQQQQQQQQGTSMVKFSSEMLRPIRCWEEARLPFSLGTIVARRYVLPSPIQSQCVPLAMAVAPTPSGKIDVLGVAETGSGKTAAYLIPLLADVLRRTPRLLGNDALIAHGPLALVVVPTRELAEQVTREALGFVQGTSKDEVRRLVQEEYKTDTPHNSNHNTSPKVTVADIEDDNINANDVQLHNTLDEIRVVKVVGGEAADAQYDALAAGAHVVVGTLGQLDALLQQRLLALGNTRFVVLDEADRMIEEQQTERLVAVLQRCPIPRQTIMLTATLSSACEDVALKYFSPDGFVVVRVPHRCSTITQVFEVMPSDPGVATMMASANHRKGGRGGNSNKHHEQEQEQEAEQKQQQQQQRQLERRRNPLIHPLKFTRLVTYLGYATGPIVVFANEKRTCDALHDELRAEAVHLAALTESFSLETLVGELPPVLRQSSQNEQQQQQQQQQQQGRRTVLSLSNMRSVALVHSEQSQTERRRLVELFRRGERRVLLTTDLLARGLDVPNISLVINYDMPMVDSVGNGNAAASASAGEEAVQKYIHRVGRTGRAGASGVAVSFVCLPSTLIQRAEQFVLRSMATHGDGSKQQMQRITVLQTSAKAKAQELDKRELTGSKNKDNDMEDFMLHPGEEDAGNDSEEDDVAEPPRVRQRFEDHQNLQDETVNGSDVFPSFSHDELLLRPLWTFLVSCVEANGAAVRGAELIQQQRCRLIQMSPVLAALMTAFAQSSPHGSITT
ncbi:Helicase [Trypanosoma melophagium]|uniref:Helicase n=1 Tax=Trypanosoma melophagium TaxID=715481 RepID=UPI00351A4FB9|nr:Helicase [Trypanosoma melophagium]